MGKQITIDETFLNETLEMFGRKIVGEAMTQFETGNTNLLSVKAAVKESLWQNMRYFKAQIRAFDAGVKFIVSPKNHK